MTVIQKQCLLVFYGCMEPGGIDGIWGPDSTEATRKLQRKLSVTADGIWGEETQVAVSNALLKHDDVLENKGETGNFWEEIRYWSRNEFRCRCREYHAPYCDGFPVEPDETLVRLADDLRHRAGAPGHCSSGIRCEKHNADSGGVYNSKHMQGKALDFFVEGVSGEKLVKLAQEDPRTKYAYIIEGQYVHVEVA